MVFHWTLAVFLFTLFLAYADPAISQGISYRDEPLSLEQMNEYKDIPFNRDNFERIADGMTEKEVLSILGKPQDMKKELRPKRRWTVHYYYPEGYVVNFRNGLVVGKEKKHSHAGAIINRRSINEVSFPPAWKDPKRRASSFLRPPPSSQAAASVSVEYSKDFG